MALYQTDFNFKNQTNFYRGKVRDVYTISNQYLVMVVSDRISAFDVVLPKPIPYKGQVLNQIAAKQLANTKDIVPNWVINIADANVAIGKICVPFKVEMVIRGYLTGSAWRAYNNGIRNICGVQIPENMKENQPFETPIITPTTKADFGHDEDISKEEIIQQHIVSEEDYLKIEKITHQLFKRGTELAKKQGLILVDTKYEFGKIGNEIYLMDEIHTPDCSRYFYENTYQYNFENGLEQKQLSKEFVRQWLIENNFQGKDGQQIPEMTPEVVQNISNRYIELYEQMMGEKFVPSNQENIDERIFNNVNNVLENL